MQRNRNENVGNSKRSFVTNTIINIEQRVVKETERRMENLAAVDQDCKKAYEVIEECLKMPKISRELIPFITMTLENWKRKFNRKRIEPNRSQIKRSIFQGDFLFLFKMAELYFN